MFASTIEVTPRDHRHTSRFSRGRGERKPHGHLCVVVLKPPVRQVLVPGDEGLCAGFLDDERGVVEEDVRSDHRLHCIEHGWVGAQFPGRAEHRVDLVAIVEVAEHPLGFFHGCAVLSGLSRRKDLDLRDHAIGAVVLNQFGCHQISVLMSSGVRRM